MAGRYAEVADLARRMRVYFANSISAVSFFTFGMLISAYFLILTPFPEAFNRWPLVVAGLVASVIAAVAVMTRFTPRGHREVDGGRWALSFSLPFLLYLVPCLTPQYSALFTTMWYPSLGLSLLAVHLLIEREELRRGVMRAKPFLLASLVILSTSPLVVYMTLFREAIAAAIFATGLMLLAYYVAGVYSLYAAHKALLEGP